MSERLTILLLGVALGVTLLSAAMILAPDLVNSPRLSCAVVSADGCMVWKDDMRVARYKAGKAGK